MRLNWQVHICEMIMCEIQCFVDFDSIAWSVQRTYFYMRTTVQRRSDYLYIEVFFTLVLYLKNEKLFQIKYFINSNAGFLCLRFVPNFILWWWMSYTKCAKFSNKTVSTTKYIGQTSIYRVNRHPMHSHHVPMNIMGNVI